MQRLIDISDTLASKYDVHTDLLHQAQNITNEILDKLEDTAASAAVVGNLFLGQHLKSWWPYIWCPVVSMVVGSYGLPPSMLRNIGLLALGKARFQIPSSRSNFYRRNNRFYHFLFPFLIFRSHSQACHKPVGIIHLASANDYRQSESHESNISA